MFIVIPVTMAAAFSTGSALIDPVPGSSALCSLKSNLLNLIHQAVTNLANEFRPYYEVKGVSGSRYMRWYDYAVTKLNHLFESIYHIGLTQELDASLRIWLNTGTVNVTVANPNTASMACSFTPSENTFSNTCPYLCTLMLQQTLFYLLLLPT
jgi:hypothetical protein